MKCTSADSPSRAPARSNIRARIWAIIEKIPYLQSLGVTAVELMPVHEFSSIDCFGNKPERPNYWGYDPLAFFAPHRGYAAGAEPGCQVREFKEMVRALHQAGIEVILDVVFNHTAEGNEYGPDAEFQGAGKPRLLHARKRRPHLSQLLRLRQHAQRQPSDRPRDDLPLPAVLGPQLSRRRLPLRSGVDLQPRPQRRICMPNPPVVESIAEDPLLADTKIIAEAWDAAGAYQVGTFGSLRWAEWNGRYRDDVRRFWRGDGTLLGRAGHAAGRFERSVPAQRPAAVSQHQFHHLARRLHAERPGQLQRKAQRGQRRRQPRRRQQQLQLQLRRRKGRPAARRSRASACGRSRTCWPRCMLSQGVPMMLMGDECRRTQIGQQQRLLPGQRHLLVQLDAGGKERGPVAVLPVADPLPPRGTDACGRRTFCAGCRLKPGGLPDVSWYGACGGPVNWNGDDRSLMCILAAVPRPDPLVPPNHHVLTMLHNGVDPRAFIIPIQARHLPWRLFVNTAAESPDDIYPGYDGPPAPADGRVILEGRSCVVFLAADEKG